MSGERSGDTGCSFAGIGLCAICEIVKTPPAMLDIHRNSCFHA